MGKMETLNLDKAALIWRLNLPLDDVTARMNVRQGDSSEVLAKRLFAQLDVTDIESLRRYYSMDFQLFGYSANAYFNPAQRKMYKLLNQNSSTRV